MTAAERARLMHWNVDCKPKAERDFTGEHIAQIIRDKNAAAIREAAKRRDARAR